MKNKILILPLFALFSLNCAAQDTTDFYSKEQMQQSKSNAPYNLRDHLFTGGNFGIQLGTITLIDVSPMLGYKITPKLSVAAGVSYIYYKDSRPPVYSQNIYGARLIGRYFILDNLFAHAEYEGLNSKWDYYKEPFIIYSLLAGAGYRQSVGEHLFFDAMLLWNFNTSVYSPYNNPIIRIGFNVGL